MSNAILRLTVTHSPLSPAVRTRLELATPGVTGRYSNRLNYRTKRSVSKNLVIGFPATDPHSRLTEFLVVCECKVTTLFRTAQVFPPKFSKKSSKRRFRASRPLSSPPPSGPYSTHANHFLASHPLHPRSALRALRGYRGTEAVEGRRAVFRGDSRKISNFVS